MEVTERNITWCLDGILLDFGYGDGIIRMQNLKLYLGAVSIQSMVLSEINMYTGEIHVYTGMQWNRNLIPFCNRDPTSPPGSNSYTSKRCDPWREKPIKMTRFWWRNFERTLTWNITRKTNMLGEYYRIKDNQSHWDLDTFFWEMASTSWNFEYEGILNQLSDYLPLPQTLQIDVHRGGIWWQLHCLRTHSHDRSCNTWQGMM